MNATKLLFSTAAAVTMAGAIGLAYAQTNTPNNSAGTPGMTGDAQSQTTTTGQAPANTWNTQNQQRDLATGSTATDTSSTSANPSGTTSGRMNDGTTSGRMNDGSTSMTNDGRTNVRRDYTGTDVGMANERPARADRN